MVSQRDILPDIRNCLHGLSADEQGRVWAYLMKRLNLATLDNEFDESWRPKLTAQLASTAVTSIFEVASTVWPQHTPYRKAKSRLDALAREALESSPSL